MQAKSLLGSAQVIDRRLEDLLSANLLADAPAAWGHAAVIRETLGDVAEQLRASVPLPATGDDPAPDDEPFFRLLDALVEYGDPTPSPDWLADRVEGGRPTLDALRDAGRVEIRGSRLLVPLDSDSAEHNWWAVLEFLRESMAAFATKANRVHSRVVVDGGDGSLVMVWDSVTERLATMRDVLDEMTANGRYARRRMRAGDGPTEFVAWTADQFRREE